MAPVGSENGVVLQKIDEATYCSIPREPELFCPYCETTFTSQKMREAYEEYIRNEAEAKQEAALKEAFDKEFAKKDSRFSRFSWLEIFVGLAYMLGFPFLAIRSLSWSFEKSSYFWFGGMLGLVVVHIIAAFFFLGKRNKAFKDFKAKAGAQERKFELFGN